MTRSILQAEKSCLICGSPDVHKHHIFHGTANRILAEKFGCWVWLCPNHHNMSDEGVHFNTPFDRVLKMWTQAEWERQNGGRDEFRRVFGKSYL